MKTAVPIAVFVFSLALPRCDLKAADVPMAAGLVARYTFDRMEGDRIPDRSGQGNDLHAVGKVALAVGRPGMKAAAISPEGYLQAPRTGSLELGGEMTLEAWIHPATNPAGGMRILDRQTIGGNDGFMLDTYPEGHLRLITACGQLRSPDAVPVDAWTFVAATCSNSDGEMRLYADGKPVAEGPCSRKLHPSDHPLNVGASQGGGDRFSGLIGEIRIYNRALTEDEIAAHAANKEIPPPASVTAALAPLPVLLQDSTPRVDYAALCARNDLVYLSPALYPFEAMHLGNGNLGACLWNQGGLTWQLNNGSYRFGGEAVSSGRITLSSPALSGLAADPPSVRFQQRLSLWDGVVNTHTEGPAGSVDGVSFVMEGADCLVYHGMGTGPHTVRLHLWPTRKAAHFVLNPDSIALTEHASHAEPFLATSMALVVKVSGARVSTARQDDQTLTLSFDPGPGGFTLYAANPLVRGTEEEALQKAREVAAGAEILGFSTLLEQRKAFWHAFWPRSFFHMTSRNSEADFLENLYYLYLYDLASMSRGGLCPKFNGGNWLTDQDTRHWGGNYWHQNTRELFWPVYAANHVDLADTFFDLYARMRDRALARGKISFHANGANYGECVPLDGGGASPPPLTPGYGAHILTVGLEVSLQAWWRWQYAGDKVFLRDRCYPLLKDSLDFYLDYAKKGPDGFYHLEPANAQETYWAVRDPHQDLAALRWAVPVAIEVSQKLGLDADRRVKWQDLLDHLAPYPVDEAKNLFLEATLTAADERHNSENVEDYGIYPFGVFGLGRPDFDRAKNTFLHRPVPGMGNGWEPAPIAAARLGLGEEASRLVLEHMRDNFRSNNGGWYSPTTDYWVGNIPDAPYFDAPGVSCQALNEMALQSQDDLIRVAPAWPEAWQAQFRLKARGGFMVTSEIHAGRPRYVLIESEWGGPCRAANPWGADVVVRSSGKVVLRTADAILIFPTAVGHSYLLERSADPVSGMKSAPLKPAPNLGPKFVGRRLPEYPLRNRPEFLGIDSQGRTPQRARMQRSVEEARARLTAATAGLMDLSTDRASAVIQPDGKSPIPAPSIVASLADGRQGPAPAAEDSAVPIAGSLILDLGDSHEISVVAFSRDRTGLRVEGSAHGYSIDLSENGTDWQTALESKDRSASPAGQVDTIKPARARFMRLRLVGQYGGQTLLDRLLLFGK